MTRHLAILAPHCHQTTMREIKRPLYLVTAAAIAFGGLLAVLIFAS
jgi:hypothetical protein